MRADELEVRLADGGHPDEVVRAGPERGERGRERQPAARLHAQGRGRHLLLRDEHLEEPVRVLAGEVLRPGRVADLAVQHDHIRPGRAERRQGRAERGPGGDLLAGFVLRQDEPAAVHRGGGRVPPGGRVRRVHRHLDVADPAEFGDGFLGSWAAACRGHPPRPAPRPLRGPSWCGRGSRWALPGSPAPRCTRRRWPRRRARRSRSCASRTRRSAGRRRRCPSRAGFRPAGRAGSRRRWR